MGLGARSVLRYNATPTGEMTTGDTDGVKPKGAGKSLP